MFETLDPSSRRLRVPVEREVLLADTVGFIRVLAPELIDDFRASLEEIETSSLILHVVDASSEDSHERMESVSRILTELHLDDILQVKVFNKSDLLSPAQRVELARRPNCLVVSALSGDGTEELVNTIGLLLKKKPARTPEVEAAHTT
jgi:GTP-binding protein HflX